jgi:hypothetical protein
MEAAAAAAAARPGRPGSGKTVAAAISMAVVPVAVAQMPVVQRTDQPILR